MERTVDLPAPVSRVWRALTDRGEFEAWFHPDAAEAFEPAALETERLLAFRWHPYEPDFAAASPTLVELRLEPTEGGTRLKLSESEFERIPIGRRGEVFHLSDKRWKSRLRNLETYVSGGA